MIRFGVAGKQGSWRSMAPRNCYKLKMDLQKIKYDTIFSPKMLNIYKAEILIKF